MGGGLAEGLVAAVVVARTVVGALVSGTVTTLVTTTIVVGVAVVEEADWSVTSLPQPTNSNTVLSRATAVKGRGMLGMAP